MSDASVLESRNNYETWDLPDLMDKLSGASTTNDEVRPEANYDSGFSEGYEKGQAEARAYYEKLMAENQHSLDTATRSLTRAKEQIDNNTIAEMAQLSALVAEQVVKTELALNPELIAQVIADLVAKLPFTHETINIALHPEDLKSMSRYESRAAGTDFERCRFVEDETLHRGDCRLSTPDSVLNSNLHDQISSMIDSSLNELLG